MQMLFVNLRAIFLFFVVAGGAFIFALPKIGRSTIGDGSGHWVLISIVLGLMLIFGVIIWIRSRGGYASDGDAETFYYLGFIYTLLTLVAVFTPLLAVGEKPSTQQVLGFFGLGLITTFVGLAGRIFFLQPQSIDTPDVGASRLAKAYSEAARQLEATALQISRVGVELEKNSIRSHKELEASIEEATRKITEDAGVLFESANARITVLTENTAKHVSHTLNSTADGVARALSEFGERLRALKLPPAEYGEQLGHSIQSLIKATTAAARSTSQFEEHISAVNAGLVKIGPEASSAAGNIASLSSATQGASTEVQQTGKALVDLRARVEDAQNAIIAMTPPVEKLGVAAQASAADFAVTQKNVGFLNSALEGLAVGVDKTSPYVSRFASQIEDTTQHFSQLLNAIAAAEELANKIIGSQKITAAEMARGVELLRAHQASVESFSKLLDKDLKASEEAIRKVHGNLIAASDFLTSKVR